MLLCKKLDDNAILPTIAHPEEDLGYDLYSSENITLQPHSLSKIKTGIAARFVEDKLISNRIVKLILNGILNIFGLSLRERQFGLLFRDRSSMASKGITVSGGVIDSGYTNELLVLLTNNTGKKFEIKFGDKIVQMIPVPVYANSVKECEELPKSERAEKGFGSSGK